MVLLSGEPGAVNVRAACSRPGAPAAGMVQGRLLQDAFYLVFFAISGILMAVILWRPTGLMGMMREAWQRYAKNKPARA